MYWDSLVPNDRHVVPIGSKDLDHPDLCPMTCMTDWIPTIRINAQSCTWITWHYWGIQEQNKCWTFFGISPAATKILRLVVLCLKCRPHLVDLRISNTGSVVGFKVGHTRKPDSWSEVRTNFRLCPIKWWACNYPKLLSPDRKDFLNGFGTAKLLDTKVWAKSAGW